MSLLSLHSIGCLIALGFVAPAVRAQAPVRTPPSSKQEIQIPRNLRPPAGMCRVWLEKVPAAQQPAPTDCASAIRNRPPNGRVIFSDEGDRKGTPANPKSKNNEKKPKKPDRPS